MKFHDLWTPRHYSLINIITWSQEHNVKKIKTLPWKENDTSATSRNVADLSEKCSVVWWVQIWNCFWKSCTSCPPGWRGKIQNPAPVTVWACVSVRDMGSFRIFQGTINAERYIQVLEQHLLPPRQCLPCLFQQHSAKTHCVLATVVWLSCKRVISLQTWTNCSCDQ